MLVENKPKQGDIVTLKLTTGEEIITKLVDVDADGISIQKPLVLQLGMDPNSGQYQLQMLPGFLFSVPADARLRIEMRHVITMCRSDDAAQKSYISSTTGLTLPGDAGKAVKRAL